jgi:hypothetical protein
VRLGQAHDNDGYLPCVFAQDAWQRPLFFLSHLLAGGVFKKITQ